MPRTLWHRLIVTSLVVLAIGVGMALHVLFRIPVPVVIGAILLVAAIAYVAVNIPPRHRLHSWGQVEQSLDNRVGQFWKSHPEDSVGQPAARKVGRNEPCPCGVARSSNGAAEPTGESDYVPGHMDKTVQVMGIEVQLRNEPFGGQPS